MRKLSAFLLMGCMACTGEVGGHGRYEQLPLGDTPNIAARIQARAAPGTIVIGNAAPEFRDVPKRTTDGQTVVDFVRITESRSVSGVYEGICW